MRHLAFFSRTLTDKIVTPTHLAAERPDGELILVQTDESAASRVIAGLSTPRRTPKFFEKPRAEGGNFEAGRQRRVLYDNSASFLLFRAARVTNNRLIS